LYAFRADFAIEEKRMEKESTQQCPDSPAWAWWELVLLAVAVISALVLSLSKLSAPSLWHDELVHLYVARHIAAHAWPALPGSDFYPNALFWNTVLAGVLRLAGDGAAAMRSPSGIAFALNVALLYVLARRLLGRAEAAVAAFAFALSPWSVAWARQARLYQPQVTMYLAVLICTWTALECDGRKRSARAMACAAAAYAAGMLTSFHSILFLGPVGGYAILIGIWGRHLRSRYSLTALICAVLGVVTLALLRLNPNEVDQSAVFENTGLGGALLDPQRVARNYYLIWLRDNLSLGFLLTMLMGSLIAPWRYKRAGLFALLAFWVPLLVLTFFIGYRRPRFLFFAFPVYTMLFAAGAVLLTRWMLRFRKSAWHAAAAMVILLFLLRLSMSAYALTRDSMITAQGADLTLARRHPQWKGPCRRVRERREPEDALLTTTWLPVDYYVGDVDNWFPNRYNAWESHESGLEGLADLAALKAFLREHPRGYFISEEVRFEKWRHHGDLPELLEEVTWVNAHMERVDEACSDDVTVYRWEFPDPETHPALKPAPEE
jgi:hypothetical protein